MSSRLPEPSVLSPSLAAAWRADRPSEVDVRRAYMRFLSKPRVSRPPAVLVALGWMLAGMLIGMGSLYAASSAGLRIFERSATSAAVAPAEAVSAVAPSRAPRLQPPPAASASANVSDAAPTAEHATHNSTVTSTPASEPEQWRRVARAMREHDYRAAEAALNELEARGGAQAEAAQLVRAQLLLSRGRDREAQVLLRALTSATSPSVRQKSTELLASVTKSDSSQRSFEPPTGSN